MLWRGVWLSTVLKTLFTLAFIPQFCRKSIFFNLAVLLSYCSKLDLLRHEAFKAYLKKNKQICMKIQIHNIKSTAGL